MSKLAKKVAFVTGGSRGIGAAVAKLDEFGKFVTSLDVQERHGNVRRAERFFRQAQEADGILAAGKKQRGAFKLSCDFTHNVNRLGFKILQMVEMITAH